jgi:hypothetical protein
MHGKRYTIAALIKGKASIIKNEKPTADHLLEIDNTQAPR